MTGTLVLNGDPAEDLEAATKQYVDNHTVSAMVYEIELPEKPSTPIADDEEIPYTWEEINAITLAGKAQEYFSLGATKLVNLSTAVLGANAATMMVIGFNQDGENTTTFQTKGTLPTTTAFGSNAVWIGSTVRTQCQNFYNACDAKSFIKTVSKGTCPNQVSGKNGTATYNDETVWIPSETEMGLDNYSSLIKSNSTTSNSECTKGYNAGYSYYTSNATRIKYRMNANSTLTTSTVWYWERSRYYNFSSSVCFVNNDGSAYGTNYGTSSSLAPAFVIGNSDVPSLPAKITQDGEDITDKVKELVGGDSSKVGDIKVTARTDLGDEWALCNGSAIDTDAYPLLNEYASERLDSALAATWKSTTPFSANYGYSFGNLKFLNGYYLWPYSTGSNVRIAYKKNWEDAWETTENVTNSILKEIYYIGDYYVLTENSSSATYAVYSKDFKSWFTGTVPAPYGNLSVSAGIVQVGNSLYGLSCSVSGYTAEMKLWKMSADSISSGFTVAQTISLSTGGMSGSAYTSGSDRWFYNEVQGKYFFAYGTGGNSSYSVSIYVLDQQANQIESKHTFSLSGTNGMRFMDGGDCVIASTSSTYSYMSKNTLDWDAWSEFTPPTTNISLVTKIKDEYVFVSAPNNQVIAYCTKMLGGTVKNYTISTDHNQRILSANGVIMVLDIAYYTNWQSGTKIWKLNDTDVGFEQINPIANISTPYGTTAYFEYLTGIWYLRLSVNSSGDPILYYVQATFPTITFDGAYAYIKVKEE